MPPSMQAEAPREEVACPKTEVKSHQARVAARACLTVLSTFYSLLVAFNLDPDRVTAFQIGMGCGHFGLTAKSQAQLRTQQTEGCRPGKAGSLGRKRKVHRSQTSEPCGPPMELGAAERTKERL